MSIKELFPRNHKEQKPALDPEVHKKIKESVLLDNKYGIRGRLGLITNPDKSLLHGYIADGLLRRKISVNQQYLDHPLTAEAKKIPIPGILPRHIASITKKTNKQKRKYQPWSQNISRIIIKTTQAGQEI